MPSRGQRLCVGPWPLARPPCLPTPLLSSQLQIIWGEDIHLQPGLPWEQGCEQVFPSPFLIFCVNGDLVALVHLFCLDGAGGEMLGVSQSPSPVSRLFFMEGCSGHPSPSFPLASPGAVGLVCPITTASCLWDASVGGGGEHAELPKLAVTPRPRACCPAGLWSRALDEGEREAPEEEEEMFV